MKQLSILFLSVFAIAAIGCGNKTSSRSLSSPGNVATSAGHKDELPSDIFKTVRDATQITINRWTIAYPKSLKDMNTSMINSKLKIEFEKFTFEIRDDTIFVDEVAFGSASSGDQILIGLNGEIAVGQEIRQPVTKN